MLKIFLDILKRRKQQKRLHKQFQDIQKWQSEMYYQKSHNELDIH